MINPIEAAVLPRKTEAIDHAEERARTFITRRTEKLVEANGDLDAIAPKFRGCSREKVAIRESWDRLTTCDRDSRGWEVAGTYRMDADRCDRFINETKSAAAEAFVAYVAKLVMKCGPVKSATLSGGFIWNASILTVETAPKSAFNGFEYPGSVEKWSTKMIVNYSVYGKAFNQFPTRKIKPKKGGRA